MSGETIRAALQRRVAKRRFAWFWDEGLISGRANKSETIDDIKAEARRKLAKKKASDRTAN